MKLLTYRAHIVPVVMFSLCAASVAAAPANHERGHCAPVGGVILTNLSVVDANTTLGTATGDLKGAVAATILSVSPGQAGTTIFSVQHHWVTESGDTILVRLAKATAVMVSPGLFAIVSYPIEIAGGTGRFDGATGDIESIGEVDLESGRTVFRYSGHVCVEERDK
jgi:hypothetical protein